MWTPAAVHSTLSCTRLLCVVTRVRSPVHRTATDLATTGTSRERRRSTPRRVRHRDVLLYSRDVFQMFGYGNYKDL
jgi:hypothetical protein